MSQSALSASFEYICCGSTAIIIRLLLSVSWVRGSIKDVRIWRIRRYFYCYVAVHNSQIKFWSPWTTLVGEWTYMKQTWYKWMLGPNKDILQTRILGPNKYPDQNKPHNRFDGVSMFSVFHHPQLTRIVSMWGQRRRPSVFDAGPALYQHWYNVWYGWLDLQTGSQTRHTFYGDCQVVSKLAQVPVKPSMVFYGLFLVVAWR